MSNANRYIILASIIIIAFFFIEAVKSENGSDDRDEVKNEETRVRNDTYKTKALKIPENLSFAGEKVELNKTDILERIDRELLVNTYWQSNALLWFKRTNKYFPIIEPILKAKGVPDDFKYLSVIESDLRNVTSPAGAKGMWQMLPGAGRESSM